MVTSEEAQRAKVPCPKGRGGVGLLDRGQLAPLPTSYTVWESGAIVPSGVRAAEIDFRAFLIPQKASSTTFWRLTAFDGKNSGEARSIACLLALNYKEARASVPHRFHRLCGNHLFWGQKVKGQGHEAQKHHRRGS